MVPLARPDRGVRPAVPAGGRAGRRVDGPGSEPGADRAGRTDPDSRARTHLANERTFLAWLRTGLALIVLGIGAAQFVSHERQLVPGVPVVTLVSVFLIVAGAALVAMGNARYRQGRARIEQAAFRPADRTVTAATVLMFVVAAAGVVLVLLLRRI